MTETQPIISESTHLPSAEEVRQWWDRYGMLDNIRQHSEVVRGVALTLTDWLEEAGVSLRRVAVEVGALAHDIAKTQCLGSDHMHDQEGAKIIQAKGYPELALLVGYHVKLPAGHPLDEIMVVNYADKRVNHTQVVSLAERYEYIIGRYGRGDPQRIARIAQGRDNLGQVEKLIFSKVNHGHRPEDLTKIFATGAGH